MKGRPLSLVNRRDVALSLERRQVLSNPTLKSMLQPLILSTISTGDCKDMKDSLREPSAQTRRLAKRLSNALGEDIRVMLILTSPRWLVTSCRLRPSGKRVAGVQPQADLLRDPALLGTASPRQALETNRLSA